MIRNKKLVSSAAWTNLLAMTLSVAWQSFPQQAFAESGQQSAPRAAGATAPTPAPAPAPDSGAAQAAGRADGTPQGAREGSERGPVDGQRAGDPEGYKKGFDACAKDAADKAYDEGFQRGMGEGSVLGQQDGAQSGHNDGVDRATSDGQADGLRRADSDSNAAAEPAGQRKGIEEANSSDAADRGSRDGAIKGDAEALAEAQRVDYARGQKDYYDQQFAQSPQSSATIVQKNPLNSRNALNQSLLRGALGSISNLLGAMVAAPAAPPSAAGPDYRYLQLLKNYPTPQENQAYSQGVREGYASGFSQAYSQAYEAAYNNASAQAQNRGCNDARHRDYREDFARGEREGRDRGYHEAYDRAFRDESHIAYEQTFPRVSNSTYQANYDRLYDRHYEDARASAYSAQVDALYGAAFDAARRTRYNAVYPTYADQQYKLGQSAEAKDFAQRPARITGVEATESIQNGVFEPGEALRVHLQVRNFSGSALKAQDVGVQITPYDPSKNVVTIKQEYLVKNLAAKSVDEIREALEFKTNELAAGTVQRYKVELTYQGKVMDSTTLEIRPNFVIRTELAETPTLKEGLATLVRVKLTNIGTQAVSGVLLNMKSNPGQLQVDIPTQNVGDMAAGESKIIEYSVIGRNIGNGGDDIQMGFVATDAGVLTGRRVGVLNLDQSFPIVNDYRIDLANNAVAALRNPGLVRIAYTIKNESKRIVFNSLQVKVRFLDTDEANFVVVGPNPQYLLPMDQGETASFTLPVLVKAANSGGTIEVEVQEAGRTVVIHRENFSLTQSLN